MTENNNQHSKLKLTGNYYRPEEPPVVQTQNNAQEAPSQAPFIQAPSYVKQDTDRLRRQRLLVAAGWVIFIVLAAALVYARFFAVIPGIEPALIKKYGMIAVGGAYLISILLALKDNMFDGLLAIVVPFYPFYYLFFNSGSILFRSLTAALLTAFGYDCLVLLQALTLALYDRILFWMQHV